ncbi:helix-turn-helix domain-containing protein [Saccharothrix variisporea]|uniref:Helix-turn-helix protein n=1 Tax=Saccharothrix variisporea TaxID=543527 RepID=A0A495X1F9_9PSEU|nr:helix-turn-helix transcriptional regulator [Saccharothrix variisporea]RKT67389.1 helix-turn-helix protein [Saccharothrix variisporea]
MSVPMNPRLLRRLIALKMVHFRTRAGLTQADAARIRGCAQSRIHYIESRRTLPNEQDLRLLLPAYGVDRPTIDSFLDLLPVARKRNWYDSLPEAVMPSWFGDFVAFEEAAKEIESFQCMLIPGLLQTESYASAVLRTLKPDLSDDEVGRRVGVRMRRQATVLDAERSTTRIRAVVTEAALRTAVGGPETHRTQLLHLLERARHPRIELQVIPADIGAHAGLDGSFTLFRLPIEDDPGLVYMEDRLRGHYYEETDAINEYSSVFMSLRRSALTPHLSSAMISSVAEEIS